MTALCLVCIALSASQPESGGLVPAASAPGVSAGVSAHPVAVPPRKGYELRDAVRAALRRWAKPADAHAEQAARELLGLYRELQADDQLAKAQKEELRTLVRGRLGQLADQIRARLAREQRLAQNQRPKSVAAPPDKAGPLAQQWAAAGAPGGMIGRGGMGFGAGPGGGFGQAGFAGQPGTQDYGQELVDLIQRTIAPRSWDVNGGPGSIYYWYPGRALVIRQTQEVHEQIGGVLEQLGRAQR